jgi:uncharacterized repeat protein (TIGR03803 family)
MKSRNFSLTSNRPLTCCIAILLLAGIAFAGPKESVIYHFKGINQGDGNNPVAGLISDQVGNLYGTTESGGTGEACTFGKKSRCGTVFELIPQRPGWTETVLYSFQGGSDGSWPQGGLVFDQVGNLYGTTRGPASNGTVFQLAPPAQQGGAWTETTIYTFNTYNDGFFPVSLIIDQAGNLYGENPGFPADLGSIFELSPPAQKGGAWTYNVIHTFTDRIQGAEPLGGLIFANDGKLYGTTYEGGCRRTRCLGYGRGVVFELKPPATQDGAWSYNILHMFVDVSDGRWPSGGVTLGPKGNLYGTTTEGGKAGDGTVFQLSPPAKRGGNWTESVIHNFDRNTESFRPEVGVAIDRKGNLYGTTLFGEVFELSPPPQQGGAWTEAVLYNFTGGRDGGYMPSGLILGKLQFKLFGTTAEGGVQNRGVVFQISLP